MDVKLEKLDVFGEGVQAFRITADQRTVPVRGITEKTRELTADAKRLAGELREQFKRDLDSRW